MDSPGPITPLLLHSLQPGGTRVREEIDREEKRERREKHNLHKSHPSSIPYSNESERRDS
jgi:hypothetical protein